MLDWVPGHFPDDPHGLGHFDGTALYEHANPKQGRHLDWGTLIYNYGRTEVTNFLVANALFWLDRYGIDGLRVDAVASMLYLDYSRPAGEWIPNKHGGRENLDAIAFLRRFNTELFGRFPQATTAAEESTAWPKVSRPVEYGGLGFGYKWNMGWMHDTLRYIGKDPIHRKHHHGDITVRPALRVLGKFHPAAVPRRGRARQALDPRPHARRRMAALRQSARLLRLHVRPSRQEAAVHGQRVRPGARVESRPFARLASARRHRTMPACGRWSAISTGSIARCRRCTSSTATDLASSGWSSTTPTTACSPGCARAATGVSAAWSSSISRPKVYRDYRIKVPFAGTWREVLNTDSRTMAAPTSAMAATSRHSTDIRPRAESRPAAAGCYFFGAGELIMRLRRYAVATGRELGRAGNEFRAVLGARAEDRAVPVRSVGPARDRTHRAAGAHRGYLARLSERRRARPALRLSRAWALSAGARLSLQSQQAAPRSLCQGGSRAVRVERHAFRAIRAAARARICRSTGATMRAACRRRSWSTRRSTGPSRPRLNALGRHDHLRGPRQGPDAVARGRAAAIARHLWRAVRRRPSSITSSGSA